MNGICLNQATEIFEQELTNKNFNFNKPDFQCAWEVFKEFTKIEFSWDEYGSVVSDDVFWDCYPATYHGQDIIQCSMYRQFDINDDDNEHICLKGISLAFVFDKRLFPQVSEYTSFSSLDTGSKNEFYEKAEQIDTFLIAKSNPAASSFIEPLDLL